MSAPTEEQGHPGGYVSGFTAHGQKKYLVESPPHWAPELRFPDSAVVYDAMRNETHLSGVLEALVQPIADAEWTLDGTGVPDNVTAFVRTELKLPTAESPLSHTYHNGVDIIDHIVEMVETMLVYGFSAAEQVYDVSEPTPEQQGLGAGVQLPGTDTKLVAHLRKLSPRPPRTITEIETERDGGLKALHQTPLEYDGPLLDGIEIERDQLVFYSHKRKGAAWEGESLFRPAYRSWALKDIYMRLDARAVDRHSSGYWKATSNDARRLEELEMKLGEVQSGERGVIAHDETDTVELIGLSGGIVDIVPRLQYLDREMSRSALAMFLDLGSDGQGNRALGEVHLRVFYKKIASVAKYIARIITEHVIADLVRHNFPAGTPYPRLTPGDVIAQQSATLDTLQTLMGTGLITTDPKLEEWARAKHGMPEKPEPDENESANAGLDGPELNARGNFVATMYRSGADFQSAAQVAGLPYIQHSGLMPVTVKTEQAIESEGERAAVRSIAASEAESDDIAYARATTAYEALRARMSERGCLTA